MPLADAQHPPIPCTLYACETCGTFSANDPHEKHAGHYVIGIGPGEYDEVSRLAAVHIVLAQRRRAGWPDTGDMGAEMREARLHADWFSEEDAEYDDDRG